MYAYTVLVHDSPQGFYNENPIKSYIYSRKTISEAIPSKVCVDRTTVFILS
jgi:hypothetical protein